MFEMKSRIARGGPDSPVRPQTVASGTTSSPGDSRPDGGSANGVPLRRTAKTKASSRPSTKTGVETPRLAMTIVPASTGELRRVAEMRPRVIPTIVGEQERDDRQLDGHRQALEKDVGDRPPVPDRVAEVALDERSGVDHELLRERLVEAVPCGERGADDRCRLLAVGGRARLARDDPDEDEHEHDDPDQDRDAGEQAANDEPGHPFMAFGGGGRTAVQRGD